MDNDMVLTPAQKADHERKALYSQFPRLLDLAAEVMGGIETGKRWLESSALYLGGEPLSDFAKTPDGELEVRDLLFRLMFGVYS